jgi:hypothetical protein
LLESPVVTKYITSYPIDGDNVVDTPVFKDNRVYIQSSILILFHKLHGSFISVIINLAQKWLKDRKGMELSFEDILHYQKIIVALSETARIMGEIDGIGIRLISIIYSDTNI